MIAFIKGTLVAASEDNVIIDTGNLGYNVKVSAETVNQITQMGKEVKLYTYTYIREDAFQLYGFLQSDDLEMFKRLITVNGIGPKGGLAILSSMSADDLRFAILSGDIKAISKAPGIGKKTAERLILDLRDKVTMPGVGSGSGLNDASGSDMVYGNSSAQNEAIEALTALGYSVSEASKAVRQTGLSADAGAEIMLKEALKHLI